MRHTLWEVAPRANVIRACRRRSTAAEDRRFELLRGCPQHAFQQCWPASTSVHQRPPPSANCANTIRVTTGERWRTGVNEHKLRQAAFGWTLALEGSFGRGGGFGRGG